MRFREASLLTKEKFEIPFLEKNVLPGSSLYGGFLVHAVGFWSMHWGSGPRTGFLVHAEGFCLWGQRPGWNSVWILPWKVLLGRSERKAPFFIMVCFLPFVHCCFAFKLRASMGVYRHVNSLWQPRGSFSGTRKKNKFV